MELRFWNKTDSLKMANGIERTSDELFERYPYARTGQVVLEISGGHVIAFDSLSILEQNYQIDPSLSDDEKLDSIKDARIRAQNPDYDAIEEIKAILRGEVD